MAATAAPHTPDLSVNLGRTDGLDQQPEDSPETEAAATAVSNVPPVWLDSDAPRHRAELEPLEPIQDYGGPRWLTAPRRRWAYTVLAAAMPLLVLYGVLTAEQAAAWAGAGAGVLGLGLAASKTTD